jgi:hypothetical protein
MKSFIIFAFVLFGTIAIAQQRTVKSTLNAIEITKEATAGHFQWVFPDETTADEIENTAKYYTTFFTYKYNVDNKTVDVYPVQDSEETRRVMLRFLGANQVNKILVGEEEFELYSYYEKFMKIK